MIKNIKIKKAAMSIFMIGTLSLVPYQPSMASSIENNQTYIDKTNKGDVLGTILGMGMLVFFSEFLLCQDLKKKNDSLNQNNHEFIEAGSDKVKQKKLQSQDMNGGNYE